MGFGDSALLGLGGAVRKAIKQNPVASAAQAAPTNTGNTKLYGQRTGSTVSKAYVTPSVRTEPRTIDDVNTVPRNIMDWKPLK